MPLEGVIAGRDPERGNSVLGCGASRDFLTDRGSQARANLDLLIMGRIL